MVVTGGRTAPVTVTERPRLTALRASWMFDGVGPELLADPVVVFDGGTIVSVQCGGAAPDGAVVIDLDGATLLPGLIDPHVHWVFDSTDDPVAHLAARDEDQALAAMVTAGRTALRGGVTTVRDLGDRNYLSLGLRGRPDLPTLVAAGPPITTRSGHCHYLGGSVAPGPTAMRAAVRDRADRGVDVIKIMASGGTLTPGTHRERAQFDAEELRAAVDEAHSRGLAVTAHAHGTAAIRNAVDAGVDGMEHVTFWSASGVDDPGDLIERIADHRIVVDITGAMRPVPGYQMPAGMAERFPLVIANMRRLHRAGAFIAGGTDAGIAAFKPPDVVRYDLTMLTLLGMGTAEALRTMTSVAAEVCRLGDRKGRLAAGFDADVLALAGNPFAEPESIHRIRAVYHGGLPVEGGTALPD